MKTQHAAWMAILLVLTVGASGVANAPACVVPEGAVAGDLLLDGGTYTGADGVEYPADVGTLIVPENRNAQDSRLIALPVIRALPVTRA